MAIFIGIDVGTSACRACAIDEHSKVIGEARTGLPAPARDGTAVEQDADVWWQCLTDTLGDLNRRLDPSRVRRLAIDATSSTLLMSDRQGRPLTPGLMYNDTRAIREAETLRPFAPADSAAQGASSSLAKLLYLRKTVSQPAYLALHQADWLAGKLTGSFGTSDENNALKMGYDPVRRCWPDWLDTLGNVRGCLPEVVPPGTVIGTVDPAVANRWHWPDKVEIAAGTTDSTAGFIATGAENVGTAVTALGSTLVVKILSDKPVFAAQYGVYSHRLGDRWLAGGASNAGGTLLRRLFTPQQIEQYTHAMHPRRLTGLDYYPLPAAGERFPVCDPHLQPRLEPRPANNAEFFQGILEGLARIEQRGYRLLADLGAPFPEYVLSVGGGAGNPGWTQIREQMLGVPVTAARQQEAAYGAALLARGG
jgi:sugar (pentulose or hexulose) kinase